MNRRLWLVLVVLHLVLTGRALPAVVLVPTLDLEGNIRALEQNDAHRIRVLVFLGTECPISQRSIPTLNELAAKYAKAEQGRVEFFGVWSESHTSRAEAVSHFKEWKVQFPILVDATGQLAAALKPSHVPEAFVLSADGEIAYHGAIDDAFEEIERRRPQVKKHFLADAVAALLEGETPALAETKAVGCFFESAPRGEGSRPAVTFNRDVAPIIFTRCTNCHREGQVAPFALTNYRQAAKRSKQISRVVGDRIMPPWMPASGAHRFVGERLLTDEEIHVVQAWRDAGAPERDPADLPPLPPFVEGWRLGEPDLIVRMQEPFSIPADGPDILQNFVIPIPTSEDKLVAAIEFHPGNARVVHHAVLFLDDKGVARKLDAKTPEPGYANFGGPGFLPSGALGGWSVGNTARRLPGGMGRYLKAGSDLVVQMHYHPTGKEEKDLSEIGIYFVPKPVAESLKEPAKLVGSIWMADYEMDIAAGEANYRRTTSYTLPRDVIMVGVVPHMHLLGKTMTVTATLPNGEKRSLIEVPNWNYNWQDEYYYERPFKLPQGTRLDVEAVFDNSAGNPSNPSSPPRRVTWGDGTLNEMLFCFFLITAERTEDLLHVVFDNLGHDMKQPRAKLSSNGGE